MVPCTRSLLRRALVAPLSVWFALCAYMPVKAQTESSAPPQVVTAANMFVGSGDLVPTPAPWFPEVQPVAASVGCPDCETGAGWSLGNLPPVRVPHGTCLSCGSGCTPGQSGCSACNGHTRIGRFACEVYRALCCPDPCYEPQWRPIADSAFFVEAARPVGQQRLRWDAGLGMVLPDRAEYFWARADGRGTGPAATPPQQAIPRLDYHELSMYTETSSGKFAFFVNQPYRSVDPVDGGHGAGFAPMDLGTKTLLFDCELLQIAFQFRTYIPIGNTRKGLSNGHASLEPSLIMGLSLAPDTYLQAQLAEWIPLGGDPDYAGAMLHYHASVNHVLFCFLPDVLLIGTVEFNGWSFQDGAYTDPVLGQQGASGDTYLSLGPGFRVSVCDKIDFGVGTAISISSEQFAEELVRTEFRFRY